MTLLRGKTYVTCPRTGKEVKVTDHGEGCAGCDHLGHTSIEGHFVLIIACRYEGGSHG